MSAEACGEGPPRLGGEANIRATGRNYSSMKTEAAFQNAASFWNAKLLQALTPAEGMTSEVLKLPQCQIAQQPRGKASA